MVEGESAIDASGALRVGYKGLTLEDKESLRTLMESPHWKVYRDILIVAVGEHMRASWRVSNVDDVVKGIHNAGLAAGINFAINQLNVIVQTSDASVQKALEKQSRKPQDFKKG